MKVEDFVQHLRDTDDEMRKYFKELVKEREVFDFTLWIKARLEGADDLNEDEMVDYCIKEDDELLSLLPIIEILSDSRGEYQPIEVYVLSISEEHGISYRDYDDPENGNTCGFNDTYTPMDRALVISNMTEFIESTR